jgi:hypothetical protein
LKKNHIFIYILCKNALAYHNADVVVANSKVIGLAPKDSSFKRG